MYKLCLDVGLCDACHRDRLPLGLGHKQSYQKVSLDTKALELKVILNECPPSKTKMSLDTIANKIKVSQLPRDEHSSFI